MSEADARADGRWAKAAKRAEGLTDLGIGSVVRRYFLFHFPLTVLVSLGVGFALAAVWPEMSGNFLRTGIYIGPMLAGLAILVVGFVYGSKKVSPMVQPQRVGVTIGLTSEEVKHVRRQVLQKEPTDTSKLIVLRGAAVQIREGLAKQLLTAPGIIFFFCGQAASRGTTSIIDVVINMLLLVMITTWAFQVRYFHKTGTFLATTTGSKDQGFQVP